MREGESRLEAARRELAEELALSVIALGPLLLSVRDEDSPFVIEFFETSAEGAPVALEHTEVRWFAVHEISAIALAPADAQFVAHLVQSSG